MKILQIGLGNFGKNHLKAWAKLGVLDHLFIAEKNRELWDQATSLGLPLSHLSQDHNAFLNQVDAVDIVTPTDSHHFFCCEALRNGQDLFVEKPMTSNAKEAEEVVSLVQKSGRIAQVGYGFRYHPVSRTVKEALSGRSLGTIRYLSGSFMGFKRPRTDVGVTHTDGIHFLDLFQWFLGEFPTEVYAVTRDHFGRGLEDTSIVLLNYPSGALAKVESGYIQPGRWNDPVVPNARTTKEIFVVGSEKTIEGDFETGKLTVHEVRFERKDPTWVPVFGNATSPSLPPVSPVDLVASELGDFLDAVQNRRQPQSDALFSGWALALLMEAIYRSAQTHRPQKIEIPSFNSFKTETQKIVS